MLRDSGLQYNFINYIDVIQHGHRSIFIPKEIQA